MNPSCYLSNTQSFHPKIVHNLWLARKGLGSMQFWSGKPLPLKNISLNSFFDEIQENFLFFFDTKVTMSIDADLGTAEIHEDTVSMLLYNMLENSIFHGGAKNISLCVRSLEGQCTIEISDDGRGIDEEILDKIFDLCFSTQHGRDNDAEAHQGVGLGEAKARLAQMGGSITCEGHGGMKKEGAEQAGAKFIITLPLAVKAAA
jgi:signal transduction histidine kinase